MWPYGGTALSGGLTQTMFLIPGIETHVVPYRYLGSSEQERDSDRQLNEGSPCFFVREEFG